MTLMNHPLGDYSFVPGIAPYSCGVIANAGFEIVHVTLKELPPWREGFRRIESFLASEHRPLSALCAISLRSPVPFSFPGFAEFNAQYAAVLQKWGVFVEGLNPVARTNIVPELVPPSEPSLFGFAFTRPAAAALPSTFVVAGAGELPEGVLQRDGIIRLGDLSAAGIEAKAAFVIKLMDDRLSQLGTGWESVTRTNVYTVHPADQVIRSLLNPRIQSAGRIGVTWSFSRPPITDIEFEMDLRGVRTDLVL